jgi:hypothetical protein
MVNALSVGGCANLTSCSKWSHGVDTEHSIANAYIAAITNAKHFVYIENQVSHTLPRLDQTLTAAVLHHGHLGQAEARQQQTWSGYGRPHRARLSEP